jgi:hypothetical protein
VVAQILMTQNVAVTRGTLLTRTRATAWDMERAPETELQARVSPRRSNIARPRGKDLAAACATAASALAVWLVSAAPALAGPPYVSDDAEPTDLGHWEIYGFVEGSHVPGDTAGQGGLDLNYGAAKDLQLTAVLAIDDQTGVAAGPGDIEIAAKYRFLHLAAGSWTPDLAVFPRVFAPTAPSRFGARRPSVLLPIWGKRISAPGPCSAEAATTSTLGAAPATTGRPAWPLCGG